ncbi:MAG: hypothetical protein JWP12_3501 [Bacteroidetes bacterium]|nr:hypothetical protein [Bacteroidota bacterium]
MIKRVLKYFFVLYLLSITLHAQVVEKNLDDSHWKFKQKTEHKWRSAAVPGTVHTDLLKHKLIPDPYIADNEKLVQWVENEDWEYKTTFTLSETEMQQSHIELQFDGLDTYASVYVNDSLVITADNMFRTWNTDVRKYVHKGKNEVYILFESAVKKGKAEAAKLNYTLPGDEKVFTRKAQYQYGWDWGPRLVTCGIWKDVKLIFWNDAKMLNVQYVQQSLSDTLAELEFICTIKSDVDANAYMDISYGGFMSDMLSGEINSKIKLKKGINTYPLYYSVKDPQRWWCNGLGFPTMYHFLITLSYDSRFLDTENIAIGLRTLELVQEKDSVGASFYFKLNGVPVFMKGANYIPPDNFLPRVDHNGMRSVVENAVNANMNMLRVWGGGAYADDEFYNQCDYHGILIWQDFMFACAMYPGDEKFIQNVNAEITQQVQRLRNHPSLALWCGNNEIDEGWHNWGWQKQYKYSDSDSTKIASDYNKLFRQEIPALIKQNDPTRFYWESSPSIGWGHNQSLQQGDSHYWGVWWGNEPFEIYNQKVGRFMSEYGFEGMPDYSTFKKIADKKELNFNSAAVKNHQKHPTGYQTIQSYMERDYKIPADFEKYIYVSQLLQAQGIKTAIEAHRRAKPYCMGTLFWQLNDCWPVTSWSSVDYYNHWKALQYQAKRSYAPLIVSVTEANKNCEVYIVNDERDTLSRRLLVQLLDFNGNAIWSKVLDVVIPPNSSGMYYSVNKNDFGDFDAKQTVLSASLLVPKAFDNSNVIHFTEESTAMFYFVKPKDLQLPKPVFRIDATTTDNDQYLVISTDVFAKDACITIDGESLNLSDNFFDLMPGQQKVIYLPRGKKIRSLKKKTHIASLVDAY